MKTTKKILALIVALITLMSAFSLQSFAAFGKELPTVESIEFTDSYPISKKELTDYLAEYDELKEEYGIEFDSYIAEWAFPYDLGNSAIPYEVEITLSDGNKAKLALNDGCAEFEDYDVFVSVSIAYDEYVNITENNAKTATLDIYAEVYDGEIVEYESTTEKPVKTCVVAAILPLGFLPSEVNLNCDKYEIADTKFLVTYADLKTETLTVTEKTNEYGGYDYYLGDIKLRIYADEENQTFAIRYLDASYTKNVTVNPEPFESVKITECDFDVENGVLNSIKYSITLNDGTVHNFEKTFTEAVVFDEYVTIGMIENYFIYLYVSDYEYTESGRLDTSNFCISIEVGYDNCQTDTFRVENPMGFFVKIKMWFEAIIEFFKMIFGI